MLTLEDRMEQRTLARYACLGLVLLACAGCGTEVRCDVEGVVRRGGKPLPEVLVTFLPDVNTNPHAARAAGLTDEEGRFRLRGEDQQEGVAAGTYIVIIEDCKLQSAPRSSDGTLLSRPPPRFLAQYANPLQTPLRQQVSGGSAAVELDLAGDL
jgi:hypothetical protein